MASIRLQNVSFRYPVYELTGRSLKLSLLRQVTGGRLASEAGGVGVQALSDVTFELAPGDRLGLIGRNGSGKSTLLRVLAGLAPPQEGLLEIKGRVVPLIEKGVGINPELSGEANIELPLRLLGANTEEINRARRDIPQFTGLGMFMQLPVRTYSEGMKTRLSFAICTALNADILILDEWLSAGDIDFHERAQARLNALIERTRIVVLASHSLDLIANVCNVVAWMDRGRLVMLGSPDTVLPAYLHSMRTPVALVQAGAA